MSKERKARLTDVQDVFNALREQALHIVEDAPTAVSDADDARIMARDLRDIAAEMACVTVQWRELRIIAERQHLDVSSEFDES